MGSYIEDSEHIESNDAENNDEAGHVCFNSSVCHELRDGSGPGSYKRRIG